MKTEKVFSSMYLVYNADETIQVIGKIQKDDRVITIISDMNDCKKKGYIHFYVKCLDKSSFDNIWEVNVRHFEELCSPIESDHTKNEIVNEAFQSDEKALELLMNNSEFRKNWSSLCSEIFKGVEKEMA